MKAIRKTLAVGALGLAMLVQTSVVGLALPVAHGGKSYCQCRCAGATDGKDLDWLMGAKGCNSNGKACRFTNDGGKTFSSGTLQGCAECKPGDSSTEYQCKPAAVSSGGGQVQRAPISGTFQRK